MTPIEGRRSVSGPTAQENGEGSLGASIREVCLYDGQPTISGGVV